MQTTMTIQTLRDPVTIGPGGHGSGPRCGLGTIVICDDDVTRWLPAAADAEVGDEMEWRGEHLVHVASEHVAYALL